MRGGTKVTVVVLHAIATVAAGALAGLVLGLPAALLGAGRPSGVTVAVVAVLAVVLDIAHTRTGRLRPPAVRHQVPIAWSRLFDPRTVAVLYGARLGVGPLTLLPTWLWWAAMGLAAATGPLLGAAAGATFGAVRAATILGVGQMLRVDAPARMARLHRLGVVTSAGCAATALVVAGTAVW